MSVQQPRFDELRAFATAARLGSVSAASRELGATQQATSARIRAFERAAGMSLLERSAAGVRLSPAGETALAWVIDVLDAGDRLANGLAILGAGRPGALTVGASQTIAAHLLPGWLVTLRQREQAHATTQVALRTANSRDIVALVRDGTLDLGFIECPEPPAGLGHARVGDDRLVCALAPDHPWAARSHVTLADVCATSLVLREAGSGTRDTLDHALQRDPALRHVSRPAPAATLATEAAVRSAVAHGLAPAVLSPLSIGDDIKLGRIVARPFAGVAPTRPLTAVWRGTRRDLHGPARALVAIAGAEAAGAAESVATA